MHVTIIGPPNLGTKFEWKQKDGNDETWKKCVKINKSTKEMLDKGWDYKGHKVSKKTTNGLEKKVGI